MTKQPFSITLKNSILEAEELMKKHCVRHAPVVDGSKLVGMISRTDLERISFLEFEGDTTKKVKYYDLFTVEQLMTKSLRCIEEEDLIKDAAEILAKVLPRISMNSVSEFTVSLVELPSEDMK